MSRAERLLLAIKAAGRRAGVELLRFNPTNSLDAARARIVRDQAIDLVVDAGANCGQWATELRAGGYRGAIVSFEPLAAAHAALAAAAADDAAWTLHRLALGDRDGEAELHVAANQGASSSLLPMGEEHRRAAPEAGYVNRETVRIARLDALELPAATRLMLKLDVQGAERAALDGATATLPRVRVIECELSLVELYEGQALMRELVDRLAASGFELWGLRPAFADPVSARLLQADGLFVRAPYHAGLPATQATAP
ncbi:MAG TPA: FkbM family methyltransferase [Solirubrobacteraceae bacterium]